MELLIKFLEYYLPALVANGSPVFVKKGTPIDGGRHFKDGRRVLGDGKTWEGFALGIIFGWTIAYDMFLLFNCSLKVLIRGALAVVGALIGDMVASFIKRRIGLERGEPAPLLDQLDFYIGATAFMWLVDQPPLNVVLFGALLTLVLHLSANYIAYVLGLKDVPW